MLLHLARGYGARAPHLVGALAGGALAITADGRPLGTLPISAGPLDP